MSTDIGTFLGKKHSSNNPPRHYEDITIVVTRFVGGTHFFENSEAESARCLQITINDEWGKYILMDRESARELAQAILEAVED